MMKVLFISNFSKTPSNTRSEKETLVALTKAGMKFVVVTRDRNSVTDEMESAGISFIFHDIPRKISISSIRVIRKTVIEGRFDIIHMTFARAVSNGLLATRNLDIKRVVYYGSMMLHWHDPTAWITYLNPKVDRIICVSDAVAEHVRKQLPTRHRHKPKRIYRGFNLAWNESLVPATRESLGIPDDAFVIGCVTNVRPVKGLKYFIKSASLLRDELPVWFVIIGNGTTSQEFAKMIESGKYSDRFKVLGVKPYPLQYIALCDLYVQPSLTEGLGRAIIEAMSVGTPTIVTSIGGAVEVVDRGRCGMVVPPADSVAIAKAIEYSIDNRPLLEDLRSRSTERIGKFFNLDDTIADYHELYMSLDSTRALSEAK